MNGVGIAFNRAGLIALFGDTNALLGAFGSASYTWESAAADYFHAWDWVDAIPTYGPPD